MSAKSKLVAAEKKNLSHLYKYHCFFNNRAEADRDDSHHAEEECLVISSAFMFSFDSFFKMETCAAANLHDRDKHSKPSSSCSANT